ncbi:MAG: hypothetical protein K2L52_01435 [Clostridia bacterium]|nr:hypothetical protein [Clostridia bacterium]
MATPKEEHRGVIEGYYYAYCPYCRMTLTQGKNGTDTFIKCPQCGRYIHVIIKDDTVLTKLKEI